MNNQEQLDLLKLNIHDDCQLQCTYSTRPSTSQNCSDIVGSPGGNRLNVHIYVWTNASSLILSLAEHGN